MRSAWLMIVAVCVALVGGGRDTRVELRAKHDPRVSATSDAAIVIVARRDVPRQADRGTCGARAIVPCPPADLGARRVLVVAGPLARSSAHLETFAATRSSRGPPVG